MTRQASRRSSHYGKRRDEEYGRDDSGNDNAPKQAGAQETRDSGSDNNESFIAEMAKGFVEAQAKISGQQTGVNQQEIYELLKKISWQLEGFDQQQRSQQNQQKNRQPQQSDSSGEGQQSQSGKQGNGAQQQTGQQNEAQSAQELRSLFSRLLQDENQGACNTANAKQGESGGGIAGGSDDGKPSTVTAQTAAQVLAQAQYELSRELEASLKKLKQVISESEILANKISNLLGEDNGSQKQ